MMETGIAVFRGREISKTIHKDERWFSVSDAGETVTDVANSSDKSRECVSEKLS